VRILQLDLRAFGPFAELSLPLHEGQYGLHLVYGPNEAGKSSSLRALTQWLYGIPRNSSDNFLHAHKEMRIGGVLESSDGTRLESIRRKGNSKTLRDGQDAQPLDEARLQRMLGGIDENTFRQRFGISYEELKRGGNAIVCGGGDLGEVLFAAGAGIGDVHQIHGSLESEMAALFTPRGSNPRINDALKRLKETRDEIKHAQLSSSEWVKLEEARSESEKRRAEVVRELAEKRSLRNRLERIAKALPLITGREGLEREHAEVADIPLLPDDFPRARGEAVTQLAHAQKSERDAAAAISRIQESLRKLDIPPGLLEHRTAITDLHSELKKYRQAVEDRPGLVTSLDDVERHAERILRDLGREPNLEDGEHLRLSRTQRHRIQTLAGDFKVRVSRQRETAKSLYKLQEDIRRVQTQLESFARKQDPSELQRVIRRARKQGELDGQFCRASAELAELRKQAEVDLARLSLWEGSLDDLERLPLPGLETVERFENDLADAAGAVKEIRNRIDEWSRKMQECDRELESLRLESDVPTEEDLLHARHRRDEGWKLVQLDWQGTLPDDDPARAEFVREFSSADADLCAAFRASLEAADALVDRLRREADRVAVKARLTAERQERTRQLGGMEKEMRRGTERLEELQTDWARLWKPLAISPHSPREMRSWLHQQRELLELAKSLRQQEEEVKSHSDRIASHRGELQRCLQGLGDTAKDDDGTLAVLLEHAEMTLEKIQEADKRRSETERRLKQLQEALPNAEIEADEARGDLEQWRNEWAEAMKALELGGEVTPAEANSVIESVDEFLGFLKEASSLRQRIASIDFYVGEFNPSVTRLLEQLAPDLMKLPVDQAVADLYDRLQVASNAQTELQGLQKQLATETVKRDAARSDTERWQSQIADLCRQAGCGSPDELAEREQRSRRRAELEDQLRNISTQLEVLASGSSSSDEFIGNVKSFDPDRLQAELATLDQEIAELDEEREQVVKTLTERQVELRRMDGSGLAAAGQEQVEHLLAAIRGDSEQYIRLRLASVLLRRAIERHREASQGPVLARASKSFSELTLNSFSSLRADYDSKGNAVLMGVRAGSEKLVPVGGMSDGTCDQLYLALRLAMLESYLEAHEPIPFIVDDILIMFDDARSIAALKALARLSEKTQVIFFTHHEHLLELAQANLAKHHLIVHRLDHRSSVSA
jgi:uncharacterized protein YhaN